MDETGDRQAQLLQEIRDLLREDVRLRQSLVEEQRAYQARAEASIAATGKRQRILFLLIVVLLTLFAAASFLGPLLFSFAGLGGLEKGFLSLPSGDALVPSVVDTSLFDGEYSLLAETSFGKMRAARDAEADPVRRQQLDLLLNRAIEQYSHFRVKRGVIRSGTRLIQELSLRQGSLEGDTLRGTALWHEDVGDPGDAAEVPILLRLQGDSLEFAMLDEMGNAGDPVVLTRRHPGR